jgi:hypothetical protein
MAACHGHRLAMDCQSWRTLRRVQKCTAAAMVRSPAGLPIRRPRQPSRCRCRLPPSRSSIRRRYRGARPSPSLDLCGVTKCNKQALAVHKARQHRQLRIARQYLDDEATCPICWMRCGSYARLLDHVSEKRMVCLLNIIFYQGAIDREVDASIQMTPERPRPSRGER